MMDKNRDLRRTTPISTVNGLPRRRPRVATFRDSADDDRQMKLKETARIRDPEQLQKKDRDPASSKRRRVDSNRLTHSSDEEYFEEEEGTRTNQLSNNRRGVRTALRSSPALENDVDEVFGVPIPRRARSASGKKLLEYRNSGSGEFGEDMRRPKSARLPATGSPIGSGGTSPTYSGVSMKNKMKYVASNSKSSSLIQDDIEIEVAEALFDLMTRSHSRTQLSDREEKVNRDATNTADDCELKRLKAGCGKVENNAFKVQNEESIKTNTEIILSESMNNKGVEKDKFRNEPAPESVSGDGFVDLRKVGSPGEGESSSFVKRNACDIKDQTVTKGDYAAIVVEANNKKEARIVIDLMELPSLRSSPGRDALLDIDPKVMTRDVQKKSETTKIGVISGYQSSVLKLEKKPKHDDISSVDDSTCQQPHGQKETNIQSPTSLLSFPIGMGSWPCVLPHPEYMPSPSARPSMTMQPPLFKFLHPRTKRCTTHRLIADNIHHHQQLVTKSLSLSSGPTTGGGVATLYGTKQLSLKSMVPTQRLPPGKDKSLNVNASADFNASTGCPALLQQVSNQALAHNILQQNSVFSFALGHHPATMMAPANSLGGPPASSRKLPANSSFPEAPSTPVTFNQHHPFFPSNEAAASYMAILQSGGRPIPIPTNISLPSFKGGPSFLNSSFYSPPMFNIAQIQHPSSQKSQTPTGDNKLLPQPEKNSNNTNNNAHAYSYHVGNSKHGDIPQQGGSKNRVELSSQHFPSPFGSNLSSMAKNSAIFQMLPEVSWNGGNKASEGKSQTDPKTDNPFLANFYQQQLLKGGSSSAAQTEYSSFLPKWDNFPKSTSTAQEGLSHLSCVSSIPQLKSSQGKKRKITLGNSPSSVQGNHPVVINNQPVVVPFIRNNASQETA